MTILALTDQTVIHELVTVAEFFDLSLVLRMSEHTNGSSLSILNHENWTFTSLFMGKP